MAGLEPCETAVTRSVAILSDFIDRNAAIAGDAALSPVGKQNKKQPLALAAVKALHEVDDKLQIFGGQQSYKLLSLYTVPAIASGNAVQALLDREIREWWRGLSPTARGAVLPKLIAGKLPAVALALQRSPIPLDSDEQQVADAWKASVRVENFGEVADLEQISRTVTWASLLVRRVAAMLVRAAGLPDQAVGDLLHEFGAQDSGPFATAFPFVPKPGATA